MRQWEGLLSGATSDTEESSVYYMYLAPLHFMLERVDESSTWLVWLIKDQGNWKIDDFEAPSGKEAGLKGRLAVQRFLINKLSETC